MSILRLVNQFDSLSVLLLLLSLFSFWIILWFVYTVITDVYLDIDFDSMFVVCIKVPLHTNPTAYDIITRFFSTKHLTTASWLFTLDYLFDKGSLASLRDTSY